MKNPTPMEVELKLALSPAGPSVLLQQPILMAESHRQQSMANTYFDTPKGDLAKARMAVRLRQVDGKVLQTVKTAGQGSGGFSQRQEWEWQVPGPTLDLEALAKLPPFQGELAKVLPALIPQLRTDFSRRSWQLTDDLLPSELKNDGVTKSGAPHQASHIELVLDEGSIISGDYRAPIREVELELKSGDPATLWTLALTLAEQVPLRPSDSSKAARGNALSKQRWPLPEAHSPAEWLYRATLALDAYHDNQQPALLTDALAALHQLAEHPALDDTARAHAQKLPSALEADGQPTAAYGSAALTLARRFSYQTALR